MYRALSSLQGGSLEMALTVSLTKTIKHSLSKTNFVWRTDGEAGDKAGWIHHPKPSIG